MFDNSLTDILLHYLESPKYQPRSKSELCRDLGIESKQRAELRQIIDSLVESGRLVLLPKGKYALKRQRQDLIEGTIRIFRSGKAIFIPAAGDTIAQSFGIGTDAIPELELKRHRLCGALDGDRVALKIEHRTSKNRRNIKGLRSQPCSDDFKARVEKILIRARSQWLGVYRPSKNGKGRVQGDGISAPTNIELAEKPTCIVKPGQLVTLEPIHYGGANIAPTGRLIEVLGYPDEPNVDVEAVIRKYDLAVDFPIPAVAEAASLPTEISISELNRREDWTTRTVITIDPATAKDFDDAIAIQKTETGWTLAVHIADVAHYVRPGSALDKEARRRGNSTYLPDRVLPMLPPKLSDDLCSLRPHIIRLTKVCEMKFNKQGNMVSSRFADAYICSSARLTYQEAYDMLQGHGEGEIPELVRETWRLASLLRSIRYNQGALDLDFPEIRAILDENGRVTDIITEEYDESHQLIEECMLAANQAVALALKNHNIPTIYRVHEDPDDAKLMEFARLCALYGHPVHDIYQRQYLNALMKSIAGAPDEQMLKLALLKSLMRARYATSPLGHYGLATANYCHFTSPIRRYADLIVHRSLVNLLTNPPEGKKSIAPLGVLTDTAEHISITERNSAAAEKEAHRLKLFDWLEAQCYAESPTEHDALVIDVRHFGVMVEIPRLQLKGLIKPEKLPGYWYFEPYAARWTCRDTQQSLSIGQRISVIPTHVDKDEQWVDFALKSMPTYSSEPIGFIPTPIQTRNKRKK